MQQQLSCSCSALLSYEPPVHPNCIEIRVAAAVTAASPCLAAPSSLQLQSLPGTPLHNGSACVVVCNLCTLQCTYSLHITTQRYIYMYISISFTRSWPLLYTQSEPNDIHDDDDDDAAGIQSSSSSLARPDRDSGTMPAVETLNWRSSSSL